MGYSNVAGDLNVYSITSTQDLIVRGDAVHYGNLLSYGASSFQNLVATNLTVTGNFTVTATNTTVSNALSIINQGTSTALYVNQNEFPNMTYNVAEFWDHTQLAMVVDGYGNVAIHTGASTTHAFTVVDGASIDTLTLGTPLAISSGGTGTATAPQNTVFAGTATGGTNPPLFRSLVNADLPASMVVSNVTANGAALSSLNASNIAFGTIPNSQLPAFISVSNVTANGAGLSSLNASNITFGTHPINTGGTNQTAYGTTNGVLYYDGTRFQAASGITASTAATLNVNTLNVSTFQTTTLIPATSGLFMNLAGTYTLSGGWTGNIAGTITSNLYNLFGATGGSGWAAIGSNPFIIGPSANGSFRFTQAGPYMITAVITADNDIKTIAVSSNTSDVHSNLANPGVWLYAFRFGVGTTQSFPVTLPINVTNTSTYYFIDIETAVQNDNIHQTAYTNVATNTYTGSYVLVRPV